MRGAGLALAATLTAFLSAQDQGFVGKKPENLGDLIAPKSVGFARKFGVKDVQGDLRLYGKVGIETAGSDPKDVLAKMSDPDMRPKASAVGGIAADVFFFGALREVAAVEAKYELSLVPRAYEAESGTRPRSNAVGSKADNEARTNTSTGRPRSNAAGSAAEAKYSRYPGEFTKVVRLCGFTIELADSNEEQQTGPKELLPGGVSTTVMVGPVPLLLRANGGVGVENNIAPFYEKATVAGATTHRLGLDGSASAYLNGWVIAGVGAGCKFASVCAGVKGDLRLMEVTVGVRLGYGTLDGLLAQLRIELQPAVLSISAIAYAEFRVWRVKIGKTFEQLLYQWSARKLEMDIGA
jgi:hypothetical protein